MYMYIAMAFDHAHSFVFPRMSYWGLEGGEWNARQRPMQRIKVTKEIMYDIYYGKASSLKKKKYN